ncbi:MAG: UvrD-helicase domain-containing protein [Gammaproteobacteria bacterium]
MPPPLVVVGSAGSGKTALMLEKLKHATGEVLYVTQSAYLAQNARNLYYASGFENENQDATFLSYREFVEAIRVPTGREAGWREFSGWFARVRQGQPFKDMDGHRAFEEIRGVIAARAGGVLSREEYRALGVRQSIFAGEERDRLYDLFGKYRAWLAEAKLYDLNLLAHEWLALAAPRYDFAMVDEVQDLTTAQLALVLKTLKAPDRFMLCGDSNQIVHPNFFSWSQVKTLFWNDPQLADRQELRVLTANFRNGPETTALANTLLKIKHQRFGSIDRESNFLVETVGAQTGQAVLLADRDSAKRELDRKIRQSTQFAVLVMRDADKVAAREYFSTPLLFSIHEAKGLEYENIVLHRFVSDHRREFAEICAGVTAEDLQTNVLEYRRARDKSDKSLEVYKFFTNTLYVALTRAVKNLYIIESDTAHALFGLLDLAAAGEASVEAKQSSLEEWQREARKLELQGKQEQAEAIRRTILKQTPPPWPVLDEPVVRDLLLKVFRERAVGEKQKRRLLEYATFHDEPELASYLAREAGMGVAQFGGPLGFEQQRSAVGRKYLAPYAARALFKRVAHGWYQFNPSLEVRRRSSSGEESWQPVFGALNLPLISEFSSSYSRSRIDWYLTSAGMPPGTVPIMAEREMAREEEESRRRQEKLQREEAERLAQEAECARLLAERERLRAAQSANTAKPRWGTREARLEAMTELQRKIDRLHDGCEDTDERE